MLINPPNYVLLTLKINTIEDVMVARQRARQITKLLNFDIASQTRIATVVSEIARNAFQYAGNGIIQYSIQNIYSQPCFSVKITDKGPGIPDLQEILAGHKSGLGIIGSKKIMDNFIITTDISKGTTVIAEMHLPESLPVISTQLLAKITDELARNRPTGASDEVQQQNQELMHALALLKKARDELELRVQERTSQLQQEITERKLIEEKLYQQKIKLAQAERINSMGEMASALAHELNQPLAAITTYIQGCIRRFATDDYEKDEVLRRMKQVAQQAQRAGQIIHRMKNFVRQGQITLEIMDLNKLIDEAITLMQQEIQKNNIELQYAYDNNLPTVKVDSIQIQQVIINLVRNAIEAMKNGKVTNPIISIQTGVANDSIVEVSIIDNGPGFTIDDPKRLLEPYFTTKKNGMGMGLSISRTIIAAHGGQLFAKNYPSGGAWFQFTLPIVSK